MTDRVEGCGEHFVDMYWHLSPSAKAELQNGRAVCRLNGKAFSLTLPADGEHRIEEKDCSPEFGKKLPHPVIHSRYRTRFPFEAETFVNMEG